MKGGRASSWEHPWPYICRNGRLWGRCRALLHRLIIQAEDHCRACTEAVEMNGTSLLGIRALVS